MLFISVICLHNTLECMYTIYKICNCMYVNYISNKKERTLKRFLRCDQLECI